MTRKFPFEFDLPRNTNVNNDDNRSYHWTISTLGCTTIASFVGSLMYVASFLPPYDLPMIFCGIFILLRKLRYEIRHLGKGTSKGPGMFTLTMIIMSGLLPPWRRQFLDVVCFLDVCYVLFVKLKSTHIKAKVNDEAINNLSTT